ncbi:hypothetical protein ABT001_35570 [Streptomyces sp. NPDC002793]|uniref:hypothetical protein n=1 Tax=Streptomyces sp. NPDC002793 TaxID=3154432 RepID=UPI003333641D
MGAWTFTHLFTGDGDGDGEGDGSKILCLSMIDHEGRSGTAAKLPTLELHGEQFVNRVDAIGDDMTSFAPRFGAVQSDPAGH